jgi:hypothetical protein
VVHSREFFHFFLAHEEANEFAAMIVFSHGRRANMAIFNLLCYDYPNVIAMRAIFFKEPL